MAYDGTLKFDTKLDSSGFRNGLSKLGGLAVSGVKTCVAPVSAAGAALGAAGMAAVKFGTDYQQASNQLQASTGATKKEMEGLSEAMKNVYADNFGESLDDVAQSMGEVRKQMGNLDGEEIQNLTEDAIILRDTFEYDVSESVRAANTIVKNFGGDGQQAFNLIAQGAQNGLDYSGELLDSISEYSVQFAKVGLDATDMFNIFQAGMDNGAFNLDKIGDAVKEFSIRAVDGSKSTAEGFALIGLSADEMAAKFAAGGEEAEEAFYQVIAGLREMEDPVEQNLAGVDLFGTMWEDLGPQVVTQLDSVKNAYSTTADTMKKLNEVRYDDLGSALETVKRHIETDLLQPVSEGVMPAVSDATDAALDAISRLADSYQTSGLTGMIEETGELFAELAVKAAEQAPKMVDAAVKFIQSFIQGISRNAPKLVSAAKSIVSALVNGLVKLLPKEVQKPVKDTINILKKSFEDGGLKSAIKTVSDILKNLGTVATNLAKTILPPLANAIDFVAENLDILLPILGGVAGAFAAQAIISQITSMMAAHEAIVKTLTAAEQANALQLMTVNGALTAKEVLVGLVTGKITLATAAQWLWNAAMEANPIGIVITAVAALAAGIAVLVTTMQQQTDEERLAAEALEAHKQKTDELRESYSQIKETAEEKASADLTEIENAKALYSQLEDLVDVNGKVSDANKGRVEFILGELNEALGTEYELNENQIEQYQEMKESIEDLILTKQAEVMLSAQEDIYREAINKRMEAQEQALASKEAVYEQEQIAEEKRQEFLELKAEREAAIADGTFQSWSIARSLQVEEAEEAWQQELAIVDEKQAVYDEDKALLESYYQDIAAYESAQTAFLGGEVQKAVNILSKQNSGFKTAASVVDESAEEQKRILANQYADSVKKLEAYAQEYEDGVEGYTQSGLDLLIQQAKDAKAEAEKVGLNITNGTIQGLESGEWDLMGTVKGMFGNVTKWAKDVLGIKSPSRVFAGIAKNTAAGFIQQIQRERANVKKATESMMEGAIPPENSFASSLVQRMKAAVAAQSHRLTMPAASSVAFSAAKLAFASGGPELPTENRAYQLEVPLYLDGREVARATAEYTDAELEEISRRKGRGG